MPITHTVDVIIGSIIDLYAKDRQYDIEWSIQRKREVLFLKGAASVAKRESVPGVKTDQLIIFEWHLNNNKIRKFRGWNGG